MNDQRSNYDLQVDIARKLFLGYDQPALIRKYQLQADEAWIYLTYLDTPCRISRSTGAVEECREGQWTPCRSYVTVMTVYDLLCFHQGQTPPTLLGQWCSVGNFIVTGVQDTTAFTARYAALFDRHLPQLRAACVAMGGTLLPPTAGADVTCRMDVTPFFPVLLQFWAGDEDFPPKLLLLWDRNTDRFLHFETTFYLQGDLLSRLKDRVEALLEVRGDL